VRLLDHFLNDNTSPEAHFFHLATGSLREGQGRGLARETAKRFLLTQLLVMYANGKFEPGRNGQKAMRYFSPHPSIQNLITVLAFRAEDYYRNSLRSQHLAEGLDVLEDDFRTLASPASCHHTTIGRLLYGLIPSGELLRYVHDIRESIVNETATIEELRRLISAVLLTIRADMLSTEDLEPVFKETGT
jgi:hypothetical protein